MNPEELARKHPRVYHVTDHRNWDGIEKHGLLSTSSLLSLFEVSDSDRIAIERRCRLKSVRLEHPVHGEAIITDNVPLSDEALMSCVDDGLAPADWYAILNRRVFFWVNLKPLGGFLQAQAYRGRERLVLKFDTFSLAQQYGEQMELFPFNSGSALRRPARRGLSTFTPLLRHDYATWRRLRGMAKPDRIAEVTVVGGVDRVADHLIDHYLTSGSCIGEPRL